VHGSGAACVKIREYVSRTLIIWIGGVAFLSIFALAADVDMARASTQTEITAAPSLASAPASVANTMVITTEDVVLSTGLRLHADRHEIQEGRVLLYTSGGITELPASVIERFEKVEHVVSVPPAPDPDVSSGKKIEVPRDPRILLRDAATRSGLPPAFVQSVAQVESALRPEAISPKGAIGVMQLMPATARALDADPTDTEQNIDAGVRLLRDLLVRYDGDVVKALSAYNAGAGAVARYGGLPPYPETQNYVDKVLRTYIGNGGH
jgi:hypothetical protein